MIQVNFDIESLVLELLDFEWPWRQDFLGHRSPLQTVQAPTFAYNESEELLSRRVMQ